MARKVTRKEYHKTRTTRSVDISQTAWREKTKKAPGRLTGPKGKLYTGRVTLADGRTAVYKEGKRIGWRGKGLTSPKKKQPSTNGGSRGGSNRTVTTTATSKGRTGFSSSAANRGGYSAKGYQRRLGPKIAGSGTDAVNAATSSGSAKVSSVTDSLMSTPRTTKWGSEAPKQGTSNRPSQWRGQQTRLKKDKSGQLRWVKVGK